MVWLFLVGYLVCGAIVSSVLSFFGEELFGGEADDVILFILVALWPIALAIGVLFLFVWLVTTPARLIQRLAQKKHNVHR